ncbi:hypothetical protein QUA20_01380 [Microcoleus sp. Pol7_A1]
MRLFWTCELKVDRQHWQIIRLTLKQVVARFVKDGKIRTEQGVDAAFLDL